MSKTIETSAAYSALGRNSKRVLEIIRAAIEAGGTGSAPIKAVDMMERLNSNSTAAIASATRELIGLGFVVAVAGSRCINTYSLSDGWRAITDPVEAKRMAAKARAAKKRKTQTRESVRASRKPPVVRADPVEVEREPEPRVRPVTLPALAWPSEAGLRLLSGNP